MPPVVELPVEQLSLLTAVSSHVFALRWRRGTGVYRS